LPVLHLNSYILCTPPLHRVLRSLSQTTWTSRVGRALVADSAVLVDHSSLWLLDWNISVWYVVELRLMCGLSKLRLMSGLSKLHKTNESFVVIGGFLLYWVRDVILWVLLIYQSRIIVIFNCPIIQRFVDKRFVSWLCYLAAWWCQSMSCIEVQVGERLSIRSLCSVHEVNIN